MAFNPQPSVTRNPELRDIEVVLFRTTDPSAPVANTVEFRITIVDQFDTPMSHVSGNLIPHLTTAQKTQLTAFMDALWTKAEDEILP